jgi:hypothetical protein
VGGRLGRRLFDRAATPRHAARQAQAEGGEAGSVRGDEGHAHRRHTKPRVLQLHRASVRIRRAHPTDRHGGCAQVLPPEA